MKDLIEKDEKIDSKIQKQDNLVYQIIPIGLIYFQTKTPIIPAE